MLRKRFTITCCAGWGTDANRRITFNLHVKKHPNVTKPWTVYLTKKMLIPPVQLMHKFLKKMLIVKENQVVKENPDERA